jgi:hypothetical protein
MTNGGRDPSRSKIYQLHMFRIALVYTPPNCVTTEESTTNYTYLDDSPPRAFKRTSSPIAESSSTPSKKQKGTTPSSTRPVTRSHAICTNDEEETGDIEMQADASASE